ncbi:GNAT family N-acetyltransferase, partial [Cohnella sp. REN36]|nr:GNAT family N-acetyltransferase [Cohnella sp. REN36]
MKNIAVLTKEASDSAVPPISFLPGPVQVEERVRTAFEQSAISHRSAQFVHDVQQVKRSLCQLTNARHVEMMLGSGTLANDVVAGQLSRLGKRGLIL